MNHYVTAVWRLLADNAAVNAVSSIPFNVFVQTQNNAGEFGSLNQAHSLLFELWQAFMYRLPGIAVGIAAMAIFIFLAKPLSNVLVKPLLRTSTSPLIRSVIQRSISLVFIIFGIYLFLFLAGLTGFAIAVVSGTGVVGLILGFAFRDIAENFISSLLLTVQRPFRIGDIVQVNEFTGIIQKVTARATTLVDFDGNHIQIPNATIYKGVIKNLTANPLMRGSFVVGVGYDADIHNAQQVARHVIVQQKQVLDDPEPQVLIDNLGASTYNVKVYFWVNVEQTSVIKMASLLMKNIIAAFEAADISMPDDARERIFPQGLALTTQDGSFVATPDSARQNGHKQKSDRPETSEGTSNRRQAHTVETNKHSDDDVATDAHEIREQARRSRDPEAGTNIL